MENQPKENSFAGESSHEKIERDLNVKITKLTLTIKDKYPELNKYLDEMTETIPDDDDADVTLKRLRNYYESLKEMIDKYEEEHPEKVN
ncbi:MAG: hypothetical protein ACFCUU_10335 [Cyclobacteriaceae bacterium]